MFNSCMKANMKKEVNKKQKQIIDDLISAGSVIAISPHSDDVAYSITGTLKKIVGVGCKVILCTIFSRSDYILSSKKNDYSVDDISRIRRNEDQEFIDSFYGKMGGLWLDYKDAPLRGYLADNTCHITVMNEIDNLQKENLYQYLLNLVNNNTNCMIIGPMAIGRHIDHIIAKEAILHLISNGRIEKDRVLFYEDLPYANDPNHSQYIFKGEFLSVDVYVEPESHFKWRSIGFYPSQMGISDWCLIMKRLVDLKICERLFYIQ